MRLIWLVVLICFPAATCLADWTEQQAVEQVAEAWGVPPEQREVRLWDGMRADLVHEGVAWEAERAGKWQEGIGQAKHYALHLRLRSGLLLLVEDPAREWRDIARAAYVAGSLGIEFRWFSPR